MKKLLVIGLISSSLLLWGCFKEEVKLEVKKEIQENLQSLIIQTWSTEININSWSIKEADTWSVNDNWNESENTTWIIGSISKENSLNKNIGQVIEQKYKNKWIETSYISDMIDKTVDLESFEIIDANYFKDKKSVYYYWAKIEWASPETFKLLMGEYSKDKNFTYCNPPMWTSIERIENADPDTFEVLEDNWVRYWKDLNSVYVSCEKVKWADPKTFKYYEWYAKDKNNIYLFQGFEGGRFFNIFEEKELTQYKIIDKDTFENIWKYYFKDKNNIYFIASYNIWDSIWIIKWADPKTFQVLWEWKAKDKNNNYLNWEITK